MKAHYIILLGVSGLRMRVLSWYDAHIYVSSIWCSFGQLMDRIVFPLAEIKQKKGILCPSFPVPEGFEGKVVEETAEKATHDRC